MSSNNYSKRKRDEAESEDRASRIAKIAPKAHLVAETTGHRGRRLISSVVEQLGTISTNKVWIKIAKRNGLAIEYEEITCGTLANAVNRTASWLRSNVGLDNDEVYAYIGPSDARYLLLTLAAAKLGCCMFLPSPHNGRDAQRRLLKDSGSMTLLHAASHTADVVGVVDGVGMEPRLVPSQEDLLDQTPVANVTYDSTYESVKNKPFIILHTSGTTGDPKPVLIPHSYYQYEDLSRTSKYADGYDTITSTPFEPGSTCLVTAPLWHAGGIFFGLLKPLLHSVVAVLPPPGMPITADLVASCLMSSEAEILQVAPCVAAELATNPLHASVVHLLKSVIIGSGPLLKSAGDQMLNLNANTLHYFGATETDLLPLLRLDEPILDWQYHRFHPLSGVSFESLGGGLHELVIKKLEDVPQPCFEVFPDAKTYSSKDVFSQHLSKSDLWKFEGRLDDVIVFSTGEKMSPTTLENAVTALPGVVGALVTGQGRSRAALLIEIDKVMAKEDIVGSVWLKVQEANGSLPTFGRIVRPLISVAGQPFERTPKGTLRRSDTEKKLAKQIDDIYRTYEAIVPRAPALEAITSKTDILDFVSSAHAAVTRSKLHPDDDIFTLSMDSMQIAAMVHTINTGLSKSNDPAARAVRLFAGHLYTHRSVAGITRALHSKITQARQEAARDPRTKHVAALQKHLTRLPQGRNARSLRPHLAMPLSEVVLTGSTGSLGTHLLHALLRNDGVKHVHCFDRSHHAADIYHDTFPADKPLLLKVSFHRINNLADTCFSLDSQIYHELCDRVTVIIHNAWPVNFQLPLEKSNTAYDGAETLDPHVGGIATLIDFAANAEHHPRIVFISSLAAVLRCSGTIPEAVVSDASVPERSGYAQSKWMGEQLLESAAKANAIRPPMIIRPGQIAGPQPHMEVVDGSGSMWDVKQTVPSLVLSSAAIGALPRSLGEKNKLRWIPVDVCAQAVIDIAGTQGRPAAQASATLYNLTNIATASRELIWTEDLLPLVRKRLQAASGPGDLEVVPLAEWYSRMLRCGPRSDNPAFKLLDFFGELSTSDEHAGLGADVATANAMASSEAFRDLGPVQLVWMEHWMKAWSL